jgi:K+-transporting ATPase ATPase A chain
MTITGWLQIALFSATVILITRPFGGSMTRVFAGERTFLSPVLSRSIHLRVRHASTQEDVLQDWV